MSDGFNYADQSMEMWGPEIDNKKRNQLFDILMGCNDFFNQKRIKRMIPRKSPNRPKQSKAKKKLRYKSKK